MKKLVQVALLLCLVSVNAQVKKDVGEFNKIKSFDQITVELIASDQERIEITGNRAEDVEVINKNGELKIRMRTGKLLEGEAIEAKVFFKNLTRIDANEGSFIGCDKTFKQGSIYASAQEGAQVKLKIETESAEFKAATGGKVKVSGTAKNVDIALGAGGFLEGKSLESQTAKVDVKAGGEAEIHASELADARVTAGGKIVFYGNPKQIKRKTTLGGKIEEVRN
ncbi:head GIN domain-containing protein [Flavobacterium caeni]|uniref:Putative auto-transporter adhesin, head GIN domain n=1 Tax=Flavobacterium caeni TaxID=490189 RepID=A0A1G5JCX5_9FLAO|nr:head GIN domain-containing protein [Flavobacterium caeni]SCY85771.1 Putative auto-transporter adhesin, head GIN domain [Flavobacterium caeni]